MFNRNFLFIYFFFDQPVKINLRTYNIQKIATGQGDGYISGCLLDDAYFKTFTC